MASDKTTIVVGEGMLELGTAGDACVLGHGGDALNTAIHLARKGQQVKFASALGTDPFSERLRHAWEGEGLDCSLVLRHPTRSPGLYAISLDAAGERSFTYWRDTSAARAMFDLPAASAILAAAERCDLLLFSLISLAVLPPEGRETLLQMARAVRRRGGLVAFDGNYRPRLWSSPAQAIAARDAAIAVASIGLPTLEDEQALAGTGDAASVAAQWSALGCEEVVVKLGPDGCLLPGSLIVAPDKCLAPVDTSGAGDAFNGGYLDARLRGADPAEAARAGHALAGWNIMRRGAIPPADATAPYA